ncbi:MAG: bifunctional phosphopantothenoylcysteine decarboxylase/phosphopantothenate--cysteine ligase CoaBC [Kangiellaceae bacterium]|nr:bifunctional phosphopantothenoylcysteine decarboxylase/phosphopantothenate--cysteine ligase CoaBC [Kangiellaceae bacterium]
MSEGLGIKLLYPLLTRNLSVGIYYLSELSANIRPIKLLLGVSGGIAAYKAADLVRRLKERNFEVRVVLTESAKQFVTPMTLQTISTNPVHQQLFDPQAEAAMGHIELAKWADILLIAPATANIIAKIAHGIADDLLTTLILATQAKIVIAPAMNQQMWRNQATLTNVALLEQRRVEFLGPDSGLQACGDVGFGRMLEPLEIAEKLLTFSATKDTCLLDKRVLITAGPTVEAIDPVRYISNHSSGKMGYALAQAAVSAGAKVTLVSGPVSLIAPEGLSLKQVVSAADMFTEVKAQLSSCDLFIGCAAVADYTATKVAEQKIKKDANEMQLSLTKNPEILSWVASQKNRPFVVGFAAESQKLEAFAAQKLKNKNLDMICANDIGAKHTGFNSDNNKILILDKDGGKLELATASKLSIATDIIKTISEKMQFGENL